jgi:thiamine-phosphate diphosphorylase
MGAHGSDAKPLDLSVYVILDRRFLRGRSLLDVARAVLRGGATILQLREKEGATREMIELARGLLEVTREAGVPLIINDRADVALAVGAEGVHVGPDDLPPEVARRLMGPERVVGFSAGTVEEALAGQQAQVDYLGVGDVFGTRTKPDAGEPIGVEGLRSIAAAVRIPVVAIGGVTAENAAQAIRAGAAGVAVISAVLSAPDPEEATRELARRVAEAKTGVGQGN